MATKNDEFKSVDGLKAAKSSSKSKPRAVIVTKRKVIGAPAIDSALLPDDAVTAPKVSSVHKKSIKLKPIDLPLPKAEPELGPESEPAPAPKPVEKIDEAPVPQPVADITPPVKKEQVTPQTAEEAEAAEASKQAEKDEALQKLIDNKTYQLPINALEKRRSHQFVVLGLALSVLLLLAWADIALDAGLIQIGNIKPVTHFFSN